MDYCNVTVIGNLTRDPELRSTQGKNLCTCAIAVNRGGAANRKTTFIDLEVWGDRADRFHSWMSKGKRVFVAGRFEMQTWTGKDDGRERQKPVIFVDEFISFDAKGEAGQGPRKPRQPDPEVEGEAVDDGALPF